METLFKAVLYVHIAGGTLGLVFSIVAMSVKKGGNSPRIFGKIFAYGMVGAGASSIVLSILHPNPFLGAIGVFSVYLSLSGMRAIEWIRLAREPKVWKDIALQTMMTLGGLGMIGWAIYNYLTTGHWQGGLVLSVFGGIGLFLVVSDYRIVFLNQRPKLFWLSSHIRKMLAATIAAYTAFLVVNGNHLPGVPYLAIWLGPTAVGSFIIVYWMRRVRAGTALK